ncbi:MAG: SseB family protein [Floccifex sp.]
MIQKQIDEFYKNPSEENYIHILQILRNYTVSIPCIITFSKKDQEKWNLLSENPIEGKIFENEDEIIFKPDTLENEEGKFFPVFLSEEEMPEDYRNHFSLLEIDFLKVIEMNLNNDLKGIVLNAFTNPIEIHKEAFEFICDCPNLTEEEDYIEYSLRMGSEAYLIKDFVQAKEYYEIAANLFNAQAMGNLGYIYTYGRVGKPDKEMGLYYFEKAANKGNVTGIMKIGDAYRYGDIYPKDEQKAFNCYRKAFEIAHEDLMEYPDLWMRLGECYLYGIGTEIDLEKAKQQLNIAIYLFEQEENEIFYYPSLKQKAQEELKKVIEYKQKN